MKLTVTEISIHKEDESPIFGDIATHVKLDDEGGGVFIKIVQHDDTKMNEIRLDFNEVEYLVKAIEMLKKNLQQEQFIPDYVPHIYPGDNTTQPDIPNYLGGPNTCGKCGMVFDGVTSYYCSHNDCPTFMKAT